MLLTQNFTLNYNVLYCFLSSYFYCFADGETEAKRLKDLSWATVCWYLLPLPRHVHRLLDFTALAAAGKTDYTYNVINSWIDLNISQKGERIPNM